MEKQKTIGDVIAELVEVTRKRGVSGILILEMALLQVIESKHYLLTADHKLLSETPGYAKAQQQDREDLERIEKLLAEIRENEAAA